MVASTYRLDGSETVVPGPLGWDTRARASRKDDALVIAVTRTIDGPSEKLRFDISDVYRLDNNGVLTLERSQGSRTRKMTYARAARTMSAPGSRTPHFVVLSFERPEGERFAIFRHNDWLQTASPSQWGSPTTHIAAMEQFVRSLELLTEETLRRRLEETGLAADAVTQHIAKARNIRQMNSQGGSWEIVTVARLSK